MGRPKRVLVDGGVYHVISRGHNRYKIFNSPSDCAAYKKLLSHYKTKFCFDLFHYCLMPNHIHLLLRITRGLELPHLMQGLNQAYAKHYKRSYGLIGNLFQGRYKGLMIDRDEYLLECARYIERNPLRAGMVKDPADYDFSSFNHYAGGIKDGIITPNPKYEELSVSREERIRLYAEYLLQPRAYETITDQKFKL
jgi:putative transposase